MVVESWWCSLGGETFKEWLGINTRRPFRCTRRQSRHRESHTRYALLVGQMSLGTICIEPSTFANENSENVLWIIDG
jgi:hypothetical protein